MISSYAMPDTNYGLLIVVILICCLLGSIIIIILVLLHDDCQLIVPLAKSKS